MSKRSGAEDPRPVKRPRLALPRPDGFIVPPKRPQQRVSALQHFVPAFDTKSTASARRRLHDIQPPQSTDKPRASAWKVLKPPPIGAVPGSGQKESKGMPKRAVTVSALKPATPHWNAEAGPSRLKPPAFASSSSSSPAPSRPKPMSKPPTFSTPSSSSSTATSALKRIPRPPTLAGRNPHAEGAVKVKPISETWIARATDINTEAGAAELLSLFLRQHGTGFVDPTEKEMKRGLEQSPEKRNKRKEFKFLRGGLADAAHRRFTSTATTQLLWEADLARLHLKGRPPRSDVQIHITAILASTPPPPSSSIISSHLSKHDIPRAPPTILLEGTVVSSHVPDLKLGAITALFRLSTSTHTDLPRHDFTVGRVVQVWRPWTHLETKVMEDAEMGAFPFAVTKLVYCFKRYFVMKNDTRSVKRTEEEMERFLYS